MSSGIGRHPVERGEERGDGKSNSGFEMAVESETSLSSDERKREREIESEEECAIVGRQD